MYEVVRKRYFAGRERGQVEKRRGRERERSLCCLGGFSETLL